MMDKQRTKLIQSASNDDFVSVSLLEARDGDGTHQPAIHRR